ncbi:type II toxin-antitoxin system RelE/ParE family toxin, partial [Maribrevibacterium harenarium]|uniref:type II toxin-antitoxin system RelE/ParE family toxin n=1 Tax=Maribrevibacterium harenarium TaxID=2589817 RepID=UPI0038B3A5C0
ETGSMRYDSLFLVFLPNLKASFTPIYYYVYIYSNIKSATVANPAVDYIRPGYRRSVCGVHAIFYRVQPDYVEIMRIIGHNDF